MSVQIAREPVVRTDGNTNALTAMELEWNKGLKDAGICKQFSNRLVLTVTVPESRLTTLARSVMGLASSRKKKL